MRRALALVFAAATVLGAAGCGAGEGTPLETKVAAPAAAKGIAQSRLSSVEVTSCRVGDRGAEFQGKLHNKASVTSSFNVSVVWRDSYGRLLDRTDSYKMGVKPNEVVDIDGFGLVAAKSLPKRVRCEVNDIDRIEKIGRAHV